jgi:hypothetical protein
LSLRCHRHSFHNAWATYLSSDLNRRLPAGYFAEANVQFGIEIDIAAFEEAGVTLGAGWIAASPTRTVPIAVATDVVEVLIYVSTGGPTLTGAIELVSPANKDCPAHREAFVSKCAALLRKGIGMVIVDVVTDRRANLHDELLTRLHAPAEVPLDADLYATAYRVVQRGEQPSLDIWQEPPVIGRPLPILPLWQRGEVCLQVDLPATYERTCREQRILADRA